MALHFRFLATAPSQYVAIAMRRLHRGLGCRLLRKMWPRLGRDTGSHRMYECVSVCT